MSSKNYKVLINNTHNVKPVITISIPTFKRRAALLKAVSSCLEGAEAIEDDFFEIVVFDNDEKTTIDDLEPLMNIKNLKYVVNEENVGMFGNWNRCIEEARGEWITILNDDDFFKNGILERFKNTIARVETENAFMFHVSLNDLRSKEIKYQRSKFLKNVIGKFRRSSLVSNEINQKEMFFQNPMYGTLSVFFKKENAFQTKLFDSAYYPVSDWDFWYNWVRLNGPIYYYEDQTASSYTIHENESLNPETMMSFPIMARKMRAEWFGLDNCLLPDYFKILMPFFEKYERAMHEVNFSKPSESKISSLKLLFKFYFLRLIFLTIRKVLL